MQIKSLADIKEKWARVTPERAADYEAGVKSPTKDWAANTAAAKDSYASGVQKAVQKGTFEKGVRRAGNDKWQRKTVEVGVGRWGAGVAAGAEDFGEGFGPYQSVISGLTLPPRYAKGDPRNIQRVAVIATALHAKKMAG